MDFGGSTACSWEFISKFLGCSESASFEWVLEKERALWWAQDEVHATLPLEPNDSSDPVVLDVSAVDENATCGLRQTLVPESWCRPPRFWSKVIPSVAEKFLLLENSSWSATGLWKRIST